MRWTRILCGSLTTDAMAAPHQPRGFSLLEMVIYVAILAVIAAVVVGSLLPLARSYREVVMALSINNAASAALERMVRDIRAASAIAPGSVFNTSPGVLVLTSTDGGGNPTTITFDVSGSAVRITEGAGTPYALTGSAATISSLTFISQANATTSTTIGIDMTVSATVGQATRTSRFVSSATLRNSY